MNYNTIILAVIVSVIVGTLVSPVAVAQSDDWPDDRGRAADVSFGTHTGEVNSPDDSDYLRVPVRKGDTVKVILNKPIRKDVELDVDVPGAYDSVSDESAETLTRKLTVEEDGFLYVEIESDTVTTDPESWELIISRNSGADEWNDNRGEANDVSPETYSGKVNSPDDTDYLRVPIETGETVTVTLNKPIRKDVELDVDVPGAYASVSDESVDTLTRKLTAEENGFLYVEIESDTVVLDPEAWSLSISIEQDSGNASPPSPDSDNTENSESDSEDDASNDTDSQDDTGDDRENSSPPSPSTDTDDTQSSTGDDEENSGSNSEDDGSTDSNSQRNTGDNADRSAPPSPPTNDDDSQNTDQDGDEDTVPDPGNEGSGDSEGGGDGDSSGSLSDSTPGFGPVLAVVALLITVGLFRARKN